MFTMDSLRSSGYAGFRPLLSLDTSTVPTSGGVYVVLSDPVQVSRFLPVSVGGRFKGKDPTVSARELAANWIDGCPVLYIGKATSLRTRLRQFRDFGRGKPIGHWGGRYIWQLENHADLIVCWHVTTVDPRQVERSMLDSFGRQYGNLPFANLRT